MFVPNNMEERLRHVHVNGKKESVHNMMDLMEISFPNLGIDLKYVPKGFTVFGFTIAIYGICIAVAVICGYLMAAKVAKKTGQNQEDYIDLAIYGVIFGIIGARVYYVVFSWDMYKNDLLSIFNIRQGGLAIYGGVIAAVITVFVFAKRRHLAAGILLDTACHGLVLGQAIGRWGNFFNRESFGEYTDGVLTMQLPISAVRSGEVSGAMRDNLLTIDGVSFIQVQPVFLYESLWCLFLLLVLLALRRKKRYQGELFMWYLAGYGLGRFVCEWLRTDKLYIPGTSVDISLLISGVLVVVFVPIVTVRRVMVKKRADIRKIHRERVFREEEESRREHKPVDKKTEEPVEKPSEKPPVQEEETIQEDKIQGETDNWENLEYAHIPSQWRKSSDKASEKQEE